MNFLTSGSFISATNTADDGPNDGQNKNETIANKSTLSLIVSTDTINTNAKKQEKKKVEQLAEVERDNLLRLTKLVVHHVQEESVRRGRSLDSDSTTLDSLLLLLERILLHGMKVGRKNFFGLPADPWNLLKSLEKYRPETASLLTSVRNLPNARSPLARARAWLRLALVQKELAEYFQTLIGLQEEVLSYFYEDWALLRSEEANVAVGLLIGLRAIDFNLALRDDNLESPVPIIHLRPYLRDPTNAVFTNPEENNEDREEDAPPMATVLDQKCYLEELTKHLQTTVATLTSRIDALTAENLALKEQAQAPDTVQPGLDSLYTELRKKYNEEAQKRNEVEQELYAQQYILREKETAMRLLEKDIHEKQDTVVSLRKQLEDIKTINLQLFNKHKECEDALKEKSRRLADLEDKNLNLTSVISQQEASIVQTSQQWKEADDSLRELGKQLAEKDAIRASLESDLKLEREWRAALQKSFDTCSDQLLKCQANLVRLQATEKAYNQLKEEFCELENTCRQHETTLVEMGMHLKDSKLKVDELLESQMSLKEAVWTDDSEATNCRQCNKLFSLARRKHHCRHCGEIYCNACSDNFISLPSSAKPVRVCDLCHTQLLQRYSAT